MKLKTLLLSVLGSVGLVASASSIAAATPILDDRLAANPQARLFLATLGPEVPFPLSDELPFPWQTIEGTWVATTADAELEFELQVQVDEGGRQILRVLQLDPADGTVIAEGLGISVGDREIVRAAMSGASGNFMIFVASVKNPDVLNPVPVTMLTLRSFGDINGAVPQDTQVIIEKVLDKPAEEHEPSQR